MRRATATVALAALLGVATPAAAQDSAVPRGQFGTGFAFRRNLGPMSERYGLGYMWGFLASYQLTRPDEPLSLGIGLSTLFGWSRFFGWLGDDDDTIATDSLSFLEMSLGLRIRYGPSEEVPVYLVASGGGTMMRTDAPVPPSEERLYLGGFAGGGVEYHGLLGGQLGLDVRYALIGTGPKSLTWMLTLGWGR